MRAEYSKSNINDRYRVGIWDTMRSRSSPSSLVGKTFVHFGINVIAADWENVYRKPPGRLISDQKDFGSSQFSNLPGLYSTLVSFTPSASQPRAPDPLPLLQKFVLFCAPVVISFRSHPVFRGRLVAWFVRITPWAVVDRIVFRKLTFLPDRRNNAPRRKIHWRST